MFFPPHLPWPGGPGCTFAEAAAYLDQIPKPVVVGALNHPGCIAVWRPPSLDPAEREYLDRLITNQRTGFTEILPQVRAGHPDVILFEGWGARTLVSVADVRQWLSDYGLTWGWRLARPTDLTHCARLLVWQSGMRWSPGDSSTIS
jgi:hypothetical protein